MSSPHSPPTPVAAQRITLRQCQLLRLVARGYGNREIAEEMQISPHTVKATLYRLSKRLGARDRANLVALAVASRQLDITGVQAAPRQRNAGAHV